MLSWLFIKRTDRQGWFRILVTIFAITMSTAILLSAMTVANSMTKVEQRLHYIQIPFDNRFRSQKEIDLSADELVIRRTFHDYQGQQINEFGLRQLTNQAPLLPGLDRQPAADEIFASPALAKLIKDQPVLKERFAGYKIIEKIPAQILVSPDSLLAIYRLSDEVLSKNSELNMAFMTKSQMENYQPTVNKKMELINKTFMAACGIGLAFPLLILIVSATRIGALQRQRRYAALSLVGASKKQINRIILSESLLAGAVGALLGTGVFQILRLTILSDLRIAGDGQRLFLNDLTVPMPTFAAVIGLILVLIVLVNWWAMRKVKSSPLGIMREQKLSKRPKIWRLLPLLAVAGLFIYIEKGLGGVNWVNGEAANMTYPLIVLGSFLTLMFGLLFAGPYLTYVFSWLMSKIVRRPITVMSSKRLKMFSQAIFSSVSGVVLALLVGSFFITSVNSAEATMKKLSDERINVGFVDFEKSLNVGHGIKISSGRTQIDMDGVATSLESQPEFRKLIKDQHRERFYKSTLEIDPDAVFGYLYTCDELAKYTQHRCEEGLSSTDLVVLNQEANPKGEEIKVKLTPVAETANSAVEDTALVYYFRNQADLDRGQILATNWLENLSRQTGSEYYTSRFPDGSFLSLFSPLNYLIDLIYIGTLLTIIVGGLSLAVATIGGFFERQRSFANLRLMGIEMKTLGAVVIVESLVPMILASIVALGVGISFSWIVLHLMIRSLVFVLPKPSYFIMVLLSLAASLLVIVAILPILKRITSLEENRSE